MMKAGQKCPVFLIFNLDVKRQVAQQSFYKRKKGGVIAPFPINTHTETRFILLNLDFNL
jgi:hypothetical protein